MEGALKLKEISYIHAEGYPAGEMKHGPISLIDEDMPVVAIAPRDSLWDKMQSNISEVQARGGNIIAVASEGDTETATLADDVIPIPRASEMLNPFLISVPMQLIAYHMGVRRGCDIDQPRNLAKTVTVE
jgi:glucosamine--fructose-6-phosphate aminotransferase (isomerizing)